ncbi:MAG TPA: YggT family protein [Ktedonobacterales bacterium]|nr:YggT family protein [Ktedonobacterales bacterium]
MAFLQTLGTMGLLHLFIKLFFGFLILSFFARMILSWLSMAIPSLSPANPLVRFFDVITGPLYDPLYRILPSSSMGAFDLRGIIAFIFSWWALGLVSTLLSISIPAAW